MCAILYCVLPILHGSKAHAFATKIYPTLLTVPNSTGVLNRDWILVFSYMHPVEKKTENARN
jgi:hypothetical protein